MVKRVLGAVTGAALMGLLIYSVMNSIIPVRAEDNGIKATFYKIGEFGEQIYSKGDDVALLQESDKLGITADVTDFSIWNGEVNNIRSFIDLHVPERAHSVDDVQNVAIRFEGIFIPEKTGEYIFRISGDDGAVLWINEEKVLNYWKADWDYIETATPVNLTQGTPVEFVLDYLQGYGNATLHVEIQEPGETTFTTFTGEGLSQKEEVSSAVSDYNSGTSETQNSSEISSPVSSENANVSDFSSHYASNPATGDFEFYNIASVILLMLVSGIIPILIKLKLRINK